MPHMAVEWKEKPLKEKVYQHKMLNVIQGLFDYVFSLFAQTL